MLSQRSAERRPRFGADGASVVCPYQFARSKPPESSSIPWGPAVLDEAHRLSNDYEPGNVIVNTLNGALLGRPEFLLTATLLQGSPLQLDGLVGILDEYALGIRRALASSSPELRVRILGQPVRGQFQISYRVGHEVREYQPDFVAETATAIWMLEPKARDQVTDPGAVAKREAAIAWYEHATGYTAANGGRLWRYALSPHDLIAENKTIDGLAAACQYLR